MLKCLQPAHKMMLLQDFLGGKHFTKPQARSKTQTKSSFKKPSVFHEYKQGLPSPVEKLKGLDKTKNSCTALVLATAGRLRQQQITRRS